MADIRSFFGGGGATKKPAKAPTPTKGTKRSSAGIDDADARALEDSDDEDKAATHERRRLKTGKDKAASSASKAKAPVAMAVDDDDDDEVQVVAGPSSSSSSSSSAAAASAAAATKSKSPPKQAAAAQPLLPKLQAKSPAAGASGKPASVSGFFGGGGKFEGRHEPTTSPSTRMTKAAHRTSTSPAAATAAAPAPPAAVKEDEAEAEAASASASKKRSADAPAGSGAAAPTSSSKKAKNGKAAATAVAAAESAAGGLSLQDLRFVVTGVFDGDITREGVEDLIKSHGGKVLTAVSGKTQYLVAGPVLEDGRPAGEGWKHKTAVEKGIPILTEQGLLDMIAGGSAAPEAVPEAVPEAAPAALPAGTPVRLQGLSNAAYNGQGATVQAGPDDAGRVVVALADGGKEISVKAENLVPTGNAPEPSKPAYPPVKSAYPPAPASTSTSTYPPAPSAYPPASSAYPPARTSTYPPPPQKAAYPPTSAYPPSSSSSSSSSSSGGKAFVPVSLTSGLGGGVEDRMWVDKYKPQSMDDVLGGQETAKLLLSWLRDWDAVHLHKTKKVAFTQSGPSCKAVLLSGPPGIGKTTMATLAAKTLQYECLELNASDTRGKKAIEQQLADVVLSRALAADGMRTLKRLVIMDEVDGMGGSDRGGIPELIKVIKASKSPIVCICNDRQAQKIRTLAGHCYDLRVKRPTKGAIAKRLVDIARKEGLEIETNAAEMLVEQVGNDIRQVLHAMQMWRARSCSLRYGDLRDGGMARIEKDKILRQSPFEACQMLLAGPSKGTPLEDRYNVYFVDYSLVPLLVQQNYVEASKNGVFKSPRLSDCDKMDALARAADAVSDMELAGASIMGADQHWELLPTTAAFACRVGTMIDGFMGFPTFPQWLGKNSSRGKFKRFTQELVLHSSLAAGQGFAAVRLEYVPYWRRLLVQPLVARGSEGAEAVIALLDAYGLSKDDFMETMREMQFLVEKDAVLADAYAGIDAQVKSALTRLYNQGGHRAQALVHAQVQAQGVKKKRGGGGGGGGGGDADDLEGGTTEDLDALRDADDDADDDDIDLAAFAKKAKGRGKAAASSSSSSSRAGAGKGGAKGGGAKAGAKGKK